MRWQDGVDREQYDKFLSTVQLITLICTQGTGEMCLFLDPFKTRPVH